MLCSALFFFVLSVVLRRLQLALPLKLHDLLCNMDHRQALPIDG